VHGAAFREKEPLQITSQTYSSTDVRAPARGQRGRKSQPAAPYKGETCWLCGGATNESNSEGGGGKKDAGGISKKQKSGSIRRGTKKVGTSARQAQTAWECQVQLLSLPKSPRLRPEVERGRVKKGQKEKHMKRAGPSGRKKKGASNRREGQASLPDEPRKRKAVG